MNNNRYGTNTNQYEFIKINGEYFQSRLIEENNQNGQKIFNRNNRMQPYNI